MSNPNTIDSLSPTKSKKQNADFSRHKKIEVEAYILTSARGFCEGHEMDDWLAAEKKSIPPEVRETNIYI